MKNSNSVINIKTANSAMLVLLLLGFLSALFWLLPNSYGISAYIFCIPLLIALLFRKNSQEYIRDSRFKTYPGWLNTIILTGLYLAITYGAIISLNALISLILPAAEEMQTIPFKESFGIVDGFLYAFAVTIITPLYEEFVFRGLALRAYEKRFSPSFASIFISILFALFHGNLVKLIYMIPGFFILARAVQVFDSWWLAVIVHIVNNSIALAINWLEVANEIGVEKSILSISPVLAPFISLLISLISFLIAIRWLEHNRSRVLIFKKSKEKVWTYDLIIFIIICLMLAFGLI